MARKGGKGQSTSGAGGAKATEGEKLSGGSAADKGADGSTVESHSAPDEKKNEGLTQRSGSLKKLPEVSEDAFARELLKPVVCRTSEERSDDPSRPGSSKTASTKDDVEEKSKSQSRDKDSPEVEQTRKDAKDMSEPKGKAAEAKNTEKIAEANTAAAAEKESSKATEEKPVASADKQDKGHVSRSATAEENKELSPGHIKKQKDHVSEVGPENQQKRRTLSVPHTAEEISALTSASLKIPMPEEVVEAEKNFEKAEDVFIKSKDRAEELVQESKDLKGDAEATKEAKQEAAVATAEAKLAEAAVQQAIKEEVRAFLDLNEKDTKTPAAETEEPNNKDQRLRAGEAKEIEAASGKTGETMNAAEGGKEAAAAAEGEEDTRTRSRAQSSSGEERGNAEGTRMSKAAIDKEVAVRKQEGVAEEEKRKSEGSVLRPALKISPAHLLEYSKRQSSDRAAILAALAVVGLDTPETRALVEAAEQEAAATAEQEAAAAAKTAAESADGELSPTAALTAFQKRTLAKLEGNQQYVLLLQQRMQEEIEALRDKYDRLMEPVFDERAHILFTGGDDEQDDKGECERKAHETGEDGKEKEGGDRKEEKQGDAATGSPKRKGEHTETADETAVALLRNEVGTRALPGFWLQAFSNHSLLASLIGQRDKPLFLYLQNVRRVFHMEKADGFSLVFEFGENPFFTPQTLTKTFKMKQEEGGGDWVVARTEGTAIQWAEGMDVTVRVIMRKQLNMRTRNERMVKEYITEKSFFYFFKNSVVPTEGELDAMSDEEQTRVFTQLKTEYDAGVTIRDLIIPYALNWYLGTASEEAEISSDESETEAETPSAAKKTASTAAEAPPAAEESMASSFASWLGF